MPQVFLAPAVSPLYPKLSEGADSSQKVPWKSSQLGVSRMREAKHGREDRSHSCRVSGVRGEELRGKRKQKVGSRTEL